MSVEFDKMMGALGMLSGSKDGAQKAFDAASAMYAPVEEANPWEASLRFFLEMGKQASQPGATVLGSAVGSGLVPLDYLTAKKKEKRDRDQKVASTAMSLAPSLAPKAGKVTYRPATAEELKQYGKTSGQMGSDGKFYDLSKTAGTGSTTKPFNVQITEAGKNAFALTFPNVTLPDNGIIPLRSDQLSILPVGSYEIPESGSVTRRTFIDTSITDDNADDNVNPQLVRLTDEEAIAANALEPGRYAVPPSGSATNVNVDLGPKNKEASEFAKTMGSATAKEFLGYMDSSNKAAGTLNSYKQILAMLNRPDFDTGMFTTAMRPLRQISREFKLDIFDTSEVTTAEVFTAKANELILASVAQMKGALSDKELNFLAEQNVNLANTTAGNKLLLLLQMQQIEKTVEFSEFANDWINANVAEDEDISSRREYSKLMSSWRSSGIMQENPYQYVIRLANKREDELVAAAGGINNLSEDDVTRIVQQLEEEFQLSYVEQTFNNVLWD